MTTKLVQPEDMLTKLEALRVVQCARMCRDKVIEEKMRMEEKLRSGWDGTATEALLFLENDLHILTSALAKLWKMYI